MNIRFYNAKILKTTEDRNFQVEEGELWVQGNKIAYIGAGAGANASSGADAREDAGVGAKAVDAAEISWDREIDVCGNLLMPGFKDAHTHTAMTFLRSYADDLPLQQWLFDSVFPREGQLTPEDVYHLDILGIMEYLTSGITSNFDMYFFPPENAKASVDCGFRTVQTSGLNDFGGTVELMEENYHKCNEMGELSSFVVGFHAEYTTAKTLMEQVSALAHKLKSPVFVHNSETALEVKECKERYGISPTQLMEQLGMFEYGGGGYHCVYFEDADFEIFKKRGLTAVTNPASNLKLASGICPVKRFVDEGISMAIGTDGAASNNSLDMFKEMFLTAALAKVRENDAECVSAEEVLYMATAGGAYAMGLNDCDRLEAGKKADLIMIDLQQPNMQPLNNIVKNLVYSGNKQNVKMTMVNGRILYEDMKFHIGFKPKEVYKKANEIIGRMK
ncbi:MAG: amidohydrolase [Eubacterium sp.]|jgi:Cytosine deaminase and related metal-dependent hydrolases|nr:amidohydrolase [Eubacterium sp.]